MKKAFLTLMIITMLVFSACTSKEAPQAGQGLNLQAVKPLLNAAAEAIAYDIETPVTRQPTAYFFTYHVAALLRDGVLADSNSNFTSDLEGNCTISRENLEKLYTALYAEGEYPGVYALEGDVTENSDSVIFHISPKGILSADLTFSVSGVSDLGGGDFLLNAILISKIPATDVETHVGEYEIVIRQEGGALLGSRLISIEPQSSAHKPARTAESGEPQPVQNPPAGSDAENADEIDNGLDAFFGRNGAEAVEDAQPLLTAAAIACVQMEFNITGTPDAEIVWRILWLMADEMGTKINGAMRTDSGVQMIYDDVVTLYLDVFAEHGDGLPETPEGFDDKIASDGQKFTFIPCGERPEVTFGDVFIEDGLARFAVRVSGESTASVLVSLSQSELSNYGFALFSAVLR